MTRDKAVSICATAGTSLAPRASSPADGGTGDASSHETGVL